MKDAARWYGWHFLPEDRKLRWDGDGKPVEIGKIYRAKGTLVLCENGMHASAHALDALPHAPGPVVSWVELLGERLDDEYKSVAVARERIHLQMADATLALDLFAIGEAKRALKKAGVSDERSWNVLEVKRAYLCGKATNEELAAAVVGGASRDPAMDPARDAAMAAAWGAGRTTAWGAASAVAPLGDAARDAANTRLERMLRKLLKKGDTP